MNENKIKLNKQIEFEYLEEKIKIKITKDRKAFINNELDYTFIKILESDGIKKFFLIEEKIFNKKNN